MIVEEHRLMRDLMRKMLGQCTGVEVVDEAYDLESALKAIRAANPDVVLIEMRLGKVDALEIIEEVRNGGCRPAFVVVSAQCDEVTAHRIEKAWVHGFVDKRVDTFEALRTALHEIKHGRRYLSPGLVQMRDTRVANPFSFDKILTKRQHEVVTSIAKMHSDEKIVKELKISPCTLRGHRRTIALKFNVPVKELAQFAREKGFGS